MSQFVSRENLQSILASKMAAFTSAMDNIARAETEAIYAGFSAQRTEQRVSEFQAMASEFESIMDQSRSISLQKANTITQGLLNRINAIRGKVKALQAKLSKYETAAKNEAFKILGGTIQALQESLESINEKMAKSNDPAEIVALTERKQELTTLIKKGQEIYKIKDNQEAMKAFYGFARDAFVVMHPERDTLTKEQLLAKLDSVQPQGDSVFDYFKSIKGIFDIYKDDLMNYSKNIVDKAEALKVQQTTLQKQESDLLEKREAIEQQEKTLVDSAKKSAFWGTIAAAISPVAGAAVTAATTAATLVQKLSVEAQKKELTEKEQENYQQAIEFAKQQQKIEEDRNNVDQQILDVQAQTNNINVQLDGVNRLIQGDVGQRIEQYANALEEIQQTMDEIYQNVSEVMKRLTEMTDLEKVETDKASHVDTSASLINDIKLSLNLAEQQIKNEKLNKNNLSSDINNIQGELKKSDENKLANKEKASKDTKQLKFLAQFKNEDKDDFLKKLCNFIRNTTSDDAKVVIDRSLSDIYEHLAGDFGERVVVDKRTGDRRDGADRRLVQAKETKEPEKKDFSFSSQRADIAGRRKGDRREGNHIFISEDTVRKLYIQS